MNEELKVIITAEIDRYKAALNQAKQQINDFKGKVAEASKDVDKKFQALGAGIASGMKTAAAGIAAALAALVGVAAATEEYRANQAKLTTAFETAGATAEQAKATYNDLYRVLGDSGQATEAAGHLAKLTTEEQALAEWTNICQGVYATFGESIPIESLAEGAAEASRTGTITAGLTDALVWAGVAEDEFNEKLQACTTQQEREALIRETLNGLYDEAAAKFEENNAQVLAQNEAQAKLTETLARVGEAIAPVVTMFTNFANEALSAVTPYIEQLAADYLPALQKILNKTAEALGKVFGFITNNIGMLATIAGIIAGISAAIGLYNVVAAVKAAMDAAQVTTLAALASAYLAQAAAMLVAIAPYALIVAAIAGVIAIIVLCVKHWDTIKAKIKSVATEAAATVREKFNSIKSGISDAVSGALSTVSSKFSSIKNTITEKINGAREAVRSAIEKIKGFFNFSWSLPKLKMPHISISGKFSINPPSVPKFSISWHKLGGVFDDPTLFAYGGGLHGLGENGAEAIVPLENNTEWLDKIADKLAAKQSATPVVLMVDGKVFAETSINTINAYTKQTGKLALNIV